MWMILLNVCITLSHKPSCFSFLTTLKWLSYSCIARKDKRTVLNKSLKILKSFTFLDVSLKTSNTRFTLVLAQYCQWQLWIMFVPGLMIHQKAKVACLRNIDFRWLQSYQMTSTTSSPFLLPFRFSNQMLGMQFQTWS